MSPKNDEFVCPPDWGVKWDPSIENNGRFCCGRCYCAVNITSKLIGFTSVMVRTPSVDTYESLGLVNSFAGTIILECTCSKRFFNHAKKGTIDYLRENHPDWPKDQNGKPL